MHLKSINPEEYLKYGIYISEIKTTNTREDRNLDIMYNYMMETSLLIKKVAVGVLLTKDEIENILENSFNYDYLIPTVFSIYESFHDSLLDKIFEYNSIGINTAKINDYVIVEKLPMEYSNKFLFSVLVNLSNISNNEDLIEYLYKNEEILKFKFPFPKKFTESLEFKKMVLNVNL